MGILKTILERVDEIHAQVQEIRKTVDLLGDNMQGSDLTFGLSSILSYNGKGDTHES